MLGKSDIKNTVRIYLVSVSWGQLLDRFFYANDPCTYDPVSNLVRDKEFFGNIFCPTKFHYLII